jgi:hypothetical protein
LWGWKSGGSWNNFRFLAFLSFSQTIWCWTINLGSGLIWQSSVCGGHCIVLPVDDILGIIHPLFFASYERLGRWQSWSSCSSDTIGTGALGEAMDGGR